MKLKLTILFLAIASIAFAQKKEIKKIAKALDAMNIEEASTIFNSIDESSVEEKYMADYTFYKALNQFSKMNLSGMSMENLNMVERNLDKAISLGYKNAKLVPFLRNALIEGKYGFAQKLASSGNSKDALVLVKQLYELDKTNYDMLFNAANLAYRSEDYDQARKMYRELIGANYTGVKTSLLATNVKNNEVENFNNESLRANAIKFGTHKDPKEEVSPSNLGIVMTRLVWLYKQNDQVNQAKGLLQSITEKYPKDASLKAVLPEIYNTLGMDEAYKKAVTSNEESLKDPNVLNNLAKTAFEAKNYEQAIDYYTKSLNIKEDFYSYALIANAYIENANSGTGDNDTVRKGYENAISNLESALKLKPESKNIKATLISLYNALGMEDKAAKLKG